MLQWILIRTFAYHFTLRYIPGITNQLADCLSWLGGQKDTIKLPKLHINQITSQLNGRCDSLNDITVATHEDDELALLKPSIIREVPSQIQSYWTFREDVTVEDGIILKGTHIVVSLKKHPANIQLIHKGHLGLGKCKLRVKDTVYLPGLNDQLQKLVINCELCLKYCYSKHKQKPSTSFQQEIPVHPWTKLATDIFHFESATYLLIMDYTSRFPVVHKLSSITGVHIANQGRLVFSEYGWPETLISENVPCYTSQVFNQCYESL